jgi:hypothetical protein
VLPIPDTGTCLARVGLKITNNEKTAVAQVRGIAGHIDIEQAERDAIYKSS